MPKKFRRGFVPIIVVLIGLFLVVCTVYLKFKSHTNESNSLSGINELTPQLDRTIPKVNPSPETSAVPDPTANWKTYTNQNYRYAVNYPQGLDLSEESYDVLFNPHQEQPGGHGCPTFYISVIPDGFWENGAIYNVPTTTFVKSLTSLKIGEKSTDGIAKGAFVRLVNIKIISKTATLYENTDVWGCQGNDRRVLVENDAKTYMIGTYYKTDNELKDFEKFLSTFKFTK